MNILFVTDHTYLPERVGGREISTHELSCAITRHGHNVKVIARQGLKSNTAVSIPKNWSAPYAIERVSDVVARAETLLKEGRADVAIYSIHNIADRLSHDKSIAARQIAYIRDANETSTWNSESFSPFHSLIANSEFIGNEIERNAGIKPLVISPYVDGERYKVNAERKFVTFVNPNVKKGLDVALDVARLCPEIPFQFVESWPLNEDQLASLKERLALLPNVTFKHRTLDMREVYVETGLLMVPSQVEEAFGRVVIEAQVSGIPVVARAIGGLPEAVGEGGILIGKDEPAEVWAEKIEALWKDHKSMDELSNRAAQNAEQQLQRMESAPLKIIDLAETLDHAFSDDDYLPAEHETDIALIIELKGTEDNLATLKSIRWQSHRHVHCYLIGQIESSELARLGFDPESYTIIPKKHVYVLLDVLKNISSPYIAFLSAGEIVAEDFFEHMLRAHLNKLDSASLAVCDSGILDPELGIVARTTTGFRHAALTTKKHREYEARLDEFGYSKYYPVFDSIPAHLKHCSAGLFRRDAVLLLIPPPKVMTSVEELRDYLMIGAHVIGGSFYVDRALHWRPRSNADDVIRPVFSQYQRIGKPDQKEQSKRALTTFFSNDGADFMLSKDVFRLLSAYLKPEEILDLGRHVPALRSELIESCIHSAR